MRAALREALGGTTVRERDASPPPVLARGQHPVRYVRVADAARYLCVSPNWLREATLRRAIPRFEIDGHTLYDTADLDAYVHMCKVEYAWRGRGAAGRRLASTGDSLMDGASRTAPVDASALAELAHRPRRGEGTSAELLHGFSTFEAVCGGDWIVLDALLRADGDGLEPTQEVWFEVARAAIEVGRSELASRIGRFLADTSARAGAIAHPPGHPTRCARGLHVLALATSGSEAMSYAEMAAGAYRAGRFAPPPDLYSLLAEWRRRRRVRVRRGLLDGLPAGLSWQQIALVTGEPDEHSAVLTVRGASRIVTFDDLCMRDGRGTRPSKRWALLKVFARERGRIRRPLGPGVVGLEGLVECMRHDLRIAFGLGGDPIPLVGDGGRRRAWQCRFAVEEAPTPSLPDSDFEELGGTG